MQPKERKTVKKSIPKNKKATVQKAKSTAKVRGQKVVKKGSQKGAVKRPVKRAQKSAAKSLSSTSVRNQAQLIVDVADLIRSGTERGEIENKILKEDPKADVSRIHKMAIIYVKDKVIADQISFYAHHLNQLQNAHDILTGKIKADGVPKVKIDYGQALKYQNSIREAYNELSAILSFC